MATVAQDIRDNLKARGVLDSWIRHGFEPQGKQGRYPIFDLDGQVIGHRLKLLTGKQKYLWSPSKPKHALAEWYILPGTAEAIAKADGICYLANGEPALHAYHTATVYNSIATTLSEVAVPPNVIEILIQLGVKTLVNIADSDNAGVLAATNWRDALHESGIGYQARQWDKALGDKADANDLWKWTSFNPDAFKTGLDATQALLLPSFEKPVVYIPDDSLPDITDKLTRALIDAIQPNMTGKVHKGWRMHRCIHHDDDKASAGINPQTGVINCFACGSHSPYESADALGIDWRGMYPKRERPQQRPTMTDAQQTDYSEPPVFNPERLEAFVETLERGERIQQCTIQDELSVKAVAYAAFDQYKSWWKTEEIPAMLYSAILNLANTRSETARVLGLMHKALLNGRLNWVLFTEADVIDAIGLDKRLVRKALQDLKEWSLVHFLSGGYIYNILHSETALNYFAHYPRTGRKPQWYTINFDLITICEEIFKRLEVRFREKLHRKTYAARTRKMAEDMGFDRVADWNGIQQRNEIVMASDALSKRQEHKLQTELCGDGTHWFGWQKALENPTIYPIDWNEVDSIKGLRSQLLIHHIQNVCSENTREDLRRLVGGSDSTLQSLYEDNHIATQQQFEKLDIAADFDDLREVTREKQRDLRGVIQKVSFKYKGEKGWHPQELPLEKVAYQYASDRERITRVFMLVCKPSRQWLMSEEEIEAKQAEVETQENSVSETPVTKVYEPIAASTPSYKTHEKKFSRSQDAIAIRMFSPHELVGDTVFDVDKEPVFKMQQAGDIERWLNDHALIKTVNKQNGEERVVSLKKWAMVEGDKKTNYIVKPYRNSDDTYIDWDLKTRLLLRNKREKHLEHLNTPEPVTEVESKIIPLPLKPKVELDERTRLFLEFCDRRMERENKVMKYLFISDVDKAG